MKKNILLVLLLLNFTIHSLAQSNYKQLISQAEDLYKSKNYVKSNEIYLLAFKNKQKDNNDFYNAACSATLAGDQISAFKFLDLSIENGWVDLAHFKSDPDLSALHNKPEWNKLIAKLQTKINQIESNYNKDAKTKLEEVYKTDQGIRQEFIAAQKNNGHASSKVDSLRKLMVYHDSLNTITVTQILDQYGWLGEDKVGAKGNLTLFLVIQHANLKTQQKYLPMLRKAVGNDKARASSLALLEDRVALREGKKQIYGSQLSSVPDQPDKYYLSPLIDPDNVDKRRASVGLQPLADYVKQWDIIWDIETYKKMLPQYEEWANRVKW